MQSLADNTALDHHNRPGPSPPISRFNKQAKAALSPTAFLSTGPLLLVLTLALLCSALLSRPVVPSFVPSLRPLCCRLPRRHPPRLRQLQRLATGARPWQVPRLLPRQAQALTVLPTPPPRLRPAPRPPLLEAARCSGFELFCVRRRVVWLKNQSCSTAYRRVLAQHLCVGNLHLLLSCHLAQHSAVAIAALGGPRVVGLWRALSGRCY